MEEVYGDGSVRKEVCRGKGNLRSVRKDVCRTRERKGDGSVDQVYGRDGSVKECGKRRRLEKKLCKEVYREGRVTKG